MTTQLRTGGCQCGGVRYEVSQAMEQVMHCNCSLCRKTHGSLFASAGIVPVDAFTLVSGKADLVDFESTPGTHRQFCRVCGGQLFTLVDDWPNEFFINLGSLDAGQSPGHAADKERHIFWESRVSWYDPGDDLPKHTGYGEG